MSESSLSITRGDLKRHIARFWGASRTIADVTTTNSTDLTDILTSGERQFYLPPGGHQWSFLTSQLSLSLTNGTASYDLPDDFSGMLDDELAFTSSKPWPLKLCPLKLLLEKQQDGTSMPSGISQPLLCAVKPKTSFSPSTGQRWQAVLWPTPTSSLTAVGRYRALPNVMSDDAYYPMGGQPHAQTLIESCLAVAEEYMNDEDGIHRARFVDLMNASIALDLRLHSQEAA